MTSQRKKTAPPTQKHSRSSSSGRKGLIAKEKTKKQSAKKRTALDNRFHRTFFRSAARDLHMPAALTPELAKHEARKRRADERPRVGCCEELGGANITGYGRWGHAERITCSNARAAARADTTRIIAAISRCDGSAVPRSRLEMSI